MKFLGSSYSFSTRIVCFLLAAYILNISIDTQDLNPDSVPEDLSVNDIESVLEFVAEELLDCNNAFAEHEERDADEGGVLDLTKAYYFSNSAISIRPQLEAKFHVGFVVSDEFIGLSRSEDVIAPPPKA